MRVSDHSSLWIMDDPFQLEVPPPPGQEELELDRSEQHSLSGLNSLQEERGQCQASGYIVRAAGRGMKLEDSNLPTEQKQLSIVV